jgi:hypothetical protein
VTGVHVTGALIAGGPLLLLSAVVWVSLRLSARRARREKAKARHPAKGCLTLHETEEFRRITGVLASEMTGTEGRC